MARPRNFLYSLSAKLILAFSLVMVVALLLAAAAFVLLRRGEQEQQALDHVIAASPFIYTEFTFLQRRGDPSSVLAEFVHIAAEEHDVRILLVDRFDGTVAEDSEEQLTGEQLTLPRDFDVSVTRTAPFRPYLSWQPQEGAPGSDLIVISALPSRIGGFHQIPPRGAERYWLMLAVPEETITRAWLDLLPGLGIAAAVALPVAALLAIGVAQYITRPLQQLTLASHRLAEGKFDVAVSVDRRDEVGRLAEAFSTMARRVGEAHTQMRTLLANVSHDLKTPLTSILGFAQALRDGGAEGEEKVRRMSGVIYEEASRLSSRLNDLLYLSELESGQTLVQRDEIDLGRLVERCLQRIEPALRGRDVRLAIDLAEGITLSADGPKLERALDNLLDNARKFTPSGGTIRIATHAQQDEPGMAHIEVANTGAHIPPEELPRLFERFYRRDRMRAGGPAGSGLGLPIARDLIELHGGTLEASVGDGEIVFTARLPLEA